MGTNAAMKKLLLAAPMLALLAGCQFWIAGHSDDKSMVVLGEGKADPATGTTKFNLQIDGTDVKCTGDSRPKRDGSQVADVDITCDDGRTAHGETKLITMDTGDGNGSDSCGNSYYMYFSTNKFTIDSKLKEYRKLVAESGNQGNDKCNAAGDIPPHTDPLI